MKSPFQIFVALHAYMYRLSAGRLGGSMGGIKVLLLRTVGHRSGKTRTVPLGFFDLDKGYLVVASNGGQPRHPGWYHNLRNQPQAAVQMLYQVMPVTAEVLSGDARARAWQHVIAKAPIYAGYEKRTTREIPLVLLHPRPGPP
jgi:deazaflavin-dependent oxidoreductase (nitroreductase family)